MFWESQLISFWSSYQAEHLRHMAVFSHCVNHLPSPFRDWFVNRLFDIFIILSRFIPLWLSCIVNKSIAVYERWPRINLPTTMHLRGFHRLLEALRRWLLCPRQNQHLVNVLVDPRKFLSTVSMSSAILTAYLVGKSSTTNKLIADEDAIVIKLAEEASTWIVQPSKISRFSSAKTYVYKPNHDSRRRETTRS